MPTIRVSPQSTTTDALSNVKFNTIPPGGAILNMWATGTTAGDSLGLSVGDRDLIVDGAEVNLESPATGMGVDRINVAQDQLLFDEVVGPGQLYLPCTLTTEMHVMIHIRYL